MAEWSKATVLKTAEEKSSVGSNPTLSAMAQKRAPSVYGPSGRAGFVRSSAARTLWRKVYPKRQNPSGFDRETTTWGAEPERRGGNPTLSASV